MVAKVNFKISLKEQKKIRVELWDLDVIKDDKIAYKDCIQSGEYDFIFNTSDTGEWQPELQLRIFNESGIEIYRTNINDTISSSKVDEATGFRENTTVDFGLIEI
jgi:hypothetical protein